MSEPTKIARNTLYLTIASILQKLIAFGYFFYLSKKIGPDNLGSYAFALSFSSIFIIFMDFGLGPVLTREGARFKENLQYYFEHVFSLKTILSVLSLVAMYLTINILNIFDNITSRDILMVYLTGIIIILDTFTFTFFSVFRALKQLKYESIGLVIYQSVILLSGVIFLKLNSPLPFMLGALMLGSLVNFLFFLYLIQRKANLHFKLVFPWEISKKFLRLALPFGIAGIFYKLTGSIDQVLLKVLAGARYVGWYALAYKLFFALTILPGSFATSFFPAISYYFKFDKEKLKETFHWSVVYMFILSLPITFFVWVLADNLILETVWKTPNNVWAASVPTLQILISGLFFVFVNYPIGNFLNACNRQTINTINMGIALGINVLLNLVLIPKLTFRGTAISALISGIILVCLGLPWILKIIKIDLRFLREKLFRVFAASSLSAWLVFYFEENLNIIWLCVIAFASYLFLLLLLRVISKSEIKFLLQSIFKAKQ